MQRHAAGREPARARRAALGRTFHFALDDAGRETGLAPGNVATLVVLGTAPAAGYPCGIPWPGFGIGGGPADLMVDASAPLLCTAPQPWTAFGAPAVHAIPVPSLAFLLNQRLYAQGLLLDVGLGRAVLTAGLDLRVGR